MASIKVTDLATLLATNIDSSYQIIVFDASGNTNQVEFEAATHQANTNIGTCSTLDESYDCGGAGLGREITADSGAVKITATGTDVALEVDGYSRLIKSDVTGNEIFISVAPADEPLTAFMLYVGDDGTLTGTKLDLYGNQQIYQNAAGNIAHGGALSDGYKMGASGATTWGKVWIEYDQPTLVRNELISDPSQNSEIRTYYNKIEVEALALEIDANVTMPTTTGAFSPPVLTTTQRNALTATAGMMIYNSTDNKHQGYDGTIWNNLY